MTNHLRETVNLALSVVILAASVSETNNLRKPRLAPSVVIVHR